MLLLLMVLLAMRGARDQFSADVNVKCRLIAQTQHIANAPIVYGIGHGHTFQCQWRRENGAPNVTMRTTAPVAFCDRSNKNPFVKRSSRGVSIHYRVEISIFKFQISTSHHFQLTFFHLPPVVDVVVVVVVAD